MKKHLFPLLIALSTSVSALAAEPATENTQPRIIYSKFDFTDENAPRPIGGDLTFSLSQPQQRFCWAITNVEGNEAIVYEVVSAPHGAIFTDRDGNRSKVTPLSNGREEHLLSKKAPINTVENPNHISYSSCYQFDAKTDPTGEYQFQTQLNQYIFPAVSYKLVP